MGGGCTNTHVARTVMQVHDHVQLGYRGTAESETVKGQLAVGRK
jgi:hypothetical protein